MGEAPKDSPPKNTPEETTKAESHQALLLSGLPGIQHRFFTRNGGVSSGLYDSLNCGPGSDDDSAAVTENRRRAAETFGISEDHLLSLHQIHSTDVITVTQAWPSGQRPRADGMVTKTPGIALAVLAADCGPVLMADPDAGVIGACHAGWRGAVGGVTEQTLEAMAALGAVRNRIIAVLGPCIAQESYEVGPEFPAPFLAQRPDNARWFKPSDRNGHHHFNLPGYLLQQIIASGVKQAGWIGHDTCQNDRNYFSYRRNCLAGLQGYGRNLSAIMLEG